MADHGLWRLNAIEVPWEGRVHWGKGTLLLAPAVDGMEVGHGSSEGILGRGLVLETLLY